MKHRDYIAPSISERTSRIRTSILAGSNGSHIHIKDMSGWEENARTRTSGQAEDKGINTLLNF